jgi:hypothetical protein
MQLLQTETERKKNVLSVRSFALQRGDPESENDSEKKKIFFNLVRKGEMTR